MKLSVIIPSLNGIEYLLPCIDALRMQTSPPEEVIVVDSTPEHAAAQLPEWGALKIHFTPGQIGVPGMRSVAFEIANGDIIAMTEDHCVPHSAWCEHIRLLHGRYPEEVIGGAVENGAVQRLVDWSCYFCEYLDFMLPLVHAPGGVVPGNNVAYKRSVFQDHRNLFTAGRWEFFVHSELARAGVGFRMDPSLQVMHCKSFTVSDFQSQSFYFSRSFGAMRGSLAKASQLWMYRLLSPFLPVMVLSRLFRKVMFEKKRKQKEFLLSLPWTIWFQICWCIGEMTGYWFGEGNSTAKVK